MAQGRPQVVAGATERILTLLLAIADRPGSTLAELARAVTLPASTALRLVRTLEARGLAARVGDGYEPGPDLVRIGLGLAAARPLPLLAQPVLDALAGVTGESAYLAMPADDLQAEYVGVSAGRHALRHSGWLGQRVPRRATAVGAALAGRVDVDGAVVRSGAVEQGVTAVSAPVRGTDGRIVAAVSAIGPSFRLDGATLDGARTAVAEAATALTAAVTGRVNLAG